MLSSLGDIIKKQKGKDKKYKKGLSRRDFIKGGATVGTATIAGIAGMEAIGAQQRTVAADFPFSNPDSVSQARKSDREPIEQKVYRQAIFFAIGDTLIPSSPNDPGYKDLEWYGITDEVNRRLEDLPDNDLDLFDKSSITPFKKRFTELSESRRAEYFNLILQRDGMKDETLQKKLKEIYGHVRELVFTIYYQNFPEDRWPRNSLRVPLLKPGDGHQITNPSTPGILTGWDLAGYAGPLTWEEEERRRNYFKKISWQE